MYNKLYHKMWREEHVDDTWWYQTLWKEKNPKYYNEWKEKNPNYFKNYLNEWRKNNTERIKENRRKYYIKNGR
jgi:RecB family exonuclease